MSNIAIFASGSGTNAERIVRFFEKHPEICVKRVLSNKPDAYVLVRAEKLGIPTRTFNREDLYHSNRVIEGLQADQTDLIVLAGFLWLIPDALLHAYPQRILNIHPALLPDYGGKGMYGQRVHEAVIADGRKESGITIHLIDEVYDRGTILHQERCPVKPDDTAESLARRIHELEYAWYPRIIEKYLQKIKDR